MVVADVNRDDLPDLVTAAFGGVSVLGGLGDGSFRPSLSFPAGDDPWSAAVGDVNRDGRADLVAANSRTNDVSVLLGLR